MRSTTIFNQLLRAGTSIGANNAEATNAISKADFKSKSFIALKEARESLYWIELLHRNKYLDDKQYTHRITSSIFHLTSFGVPLVLLWSSFGVPLVSFRKPVTWNRPKADENRFRHSWLSPTEPSAPIRGISPWLRKLRHRLDNLTGIRLLAQVVTV